MSVLNISAYRFVALEDLPDLRAALRQRCAAGNLKGTVLLAPEGINLFLAGAAEPLRGLLHWLREDPRFTGLEAKESWSEEQPFNRMLVKIKREIITMRAPQVRPAAGRAAAVDARTLKGWLDAGRDDQGRELVLLDTRNAFEVAIGSFAAARDLRLASFGEFPQRVDALLPELAGKAVVTFCTGGIRCEKAALYLEEQGLDAVYQLDGGILRYFETVGAEHYRGDCFVFDRRVALTPALTAAGHAECFNCRAVLTPEEMGDARYVIGQSCPRCGPAAS
ncbi:MAG: sulfurtransferase [Burkholderiales bacterium]